MGGWSGQGKGSCGQLSSLIKDRIYGARPFGLFRLPHKGWRNNNKPENRKARLPLLNPASFEAKDASKRKCAEVLTTAKTFTVKRNYIFLVSHSTLRSNICSFKLQLNVANNLEAISLEVWKKHLPVCFTYITQTASTSREVVIQKVCTKHLLGTSRGNYSTQSANKQARST